MVITDTVLIPGGDIPPGSSQTPVAGGQLLVFLTAPKMTSAQAKTYARPVATAVINPTTAAVSVTLADLASFSIPGALYRAVFLTVDTEWFEIWTVGAGSGPTTMAAVRTRGQYTQDTDYGLAPEDGLRLEIMELAARVSACEARLTAGNL
jgi:hypothetical protein